MKPFSRAFALLALFATVAAAPAPSPSADLLQRAAAQASRVKSYTASVHADVALHTFPYLSPALDGTYYHKEPNKDKIVFTSGLPVVAKQFSKVYPRVESPSRWNDVYVVSSEGSSGGVTTYKLVPRKRGRIDHIDASVDEKSATVVGLRWVYNDGGYAQLHQRYAEVNGTLVVVEQNGHFEVPNYNADLKSTFSNFKINASIPDSVFQES